MNLQYHKCTQTCKKNVKSNQTCRFNYPLPPMRKTTILLPLESPISNEEKKKAQNLNREIKQKTELIARLHEDCSFDEYLDYLGVTEESYIIAIRSNLKRPTVFLRRNLNERKINAYNREMLILWEAHMDIQFIVSPYGCVSYVVSYVSKSQKGMSKLLKEVADQVSAGNDTMSKKLFKIVNAFLNNCEISAQEIALHVLSIPMSRSSIADIYINTVPAEERTFMRKSQKELQLLQEEDPDNTDIGEKGLIDRYQQRPEKLNSLCLADFAATYEYTKTKKIKQNQSTLDDDFDEVNDDAELHELQPLNTYELTDKSGYIHERRRRKIIRFRRYKQDEDKDNYIRENLMLFVPWHTEPSLQDKDLQQNFETNKDLIRFNRSKYCKHDETFDNITIDIQEVENEDEQMNQRASQFAIFELENTESDIALEMPRTSRLNNIDCGKFPIPQLQKEQDYLQTIRALNEKQRRYLHNVMHIIKTKPNEQFFHFLTGGAGVGKTKLMTAVIESAERFWIHELHNNPDKVRIIVCAATGKAACNIGGCTINSAFGLGWNAHHKCINGRKLPSDIRNTLAVALSNLKLIVVDEISICGYHQFQAMNNVLQELFENNKPFGGISIITIGDFHQLAPVRDNYVFDPPQNTMNKIHGSYLWANFKLYELTEVMRQRDDKRFAEALNRLRVGRTTEEDNELFRSRQIDVLGIDANTLLHNTVAIFHENAVVDCHNNLVLADYNEYEMSPCLDVVNGVKDEKDKTALLAISDSLHYKKTQNLPKLIKLCVGARYVLTHNIAVPDHLANGASLTLRKIIMGRNGNTGDLIPLRVYAEFDDEIAGTKTRETNRATMTKDQVNFEEKLTPLERIFRSFTVTKSLTQSITRNQLPLTPAQALTIYGVQGSTYERVLVKVTNLIRKALYTALSRVTSIFGLFLIGIFLAPRPATIHNDKSFAEIERMKEYCNLIFDLLFPEDAKTDDNLICIYHNIRSLNLHFPDVKECESFTASDLIMLVETWTLISDVYEIDGFTCIHRTDCQTQKRKAFGTIIFVKTSLLPEVQVYYEKQTIVSNTNHCTVVGVKIKTTNICLVYKSPKASFTLLQNMLHECIIESYSQNVQHSYFIGDFNIKCQLSDANFEKLEDFFSQYNVQFILNKDEVSTDHNSLIDLCFSTNQQTRAHVFESVISDHKPIWFQI